MDTHIRSVHEVLPAAAKQWTRPPCVYPAPKIFLLFIQKLFYWGGGKILIYDLDSDTRIGSNFSPSVCNPSVMLSSPVSMVPGHIWLALPKRKNFFTQGAFFLSPLCFTLVFGSYFWNRLEQQIKIWGMRQKTKLMRSSNLLSDFRTRLSGGLNISNPRIWKRCKVYYNIKLCFTKITEAFFPQSWQRVTQIVL